MNYNQYKLKKSKEFSQRKNIHSQIVREKLQNERDEKVWNSIYDSLNNNLDISRDILELAKEKQWRSEKLLKGLKITVECVENNPYF
ncbi:MAG: hypothetical protein ACRCXQ_14560 [Vagococcus fluvialis]